MFSLSVSDVTVIEKMQKKNPFDKDVKSTNKNNNSFTV